MKISVAIVLFSVLMLASADKLPIDIYIEALCKYSKQFIVFQLRTAYPEIKNNVKINIYCHGKSQSYTDEQGNTAFECQHGPIECENNKLQTCALDILSGDQDRQVAFVVCAMTGTKTYQKCAENVGLVFADVEACAKGPRGTELQLKAQEKTAPIIEESKHVPTIRYNNIYNETEYAQSLIDFKGVAQKKIIGPV